MYKETKIGSTTGLTHVGSEPNRERRAEQVYVFATNSDGRPIAIEGWVGYSIGQRIELTHGQAKELIPLLVEAVTR